MKKINLHGYNKITKQTFRFSFNDLIRRKGELPSEGAASPRDRTTAPRRDYVLHGGGSVDAPAIKWASSQCTLMAFAGSSAASNRLLAERGARRVSSPLWDTCGAAGNSRFCDAIANHQ